MAAYKAVMRPALEYASSVWSPIASSTSINKLQVMQYAALRTATGCTQDTNIQHLHDETLILPIHSHLQLHAAQYQQKTQHPSHSFKKNSCYTSNIPTDPHTVTATDIKTNMSHIHTFSISMHLATRDNNKILRTPPPLDLWADPAEVMEQLDGEAGWWTTSGIIGLPPPPTRVMGVCRCTVH